MPDYAIRIELLGNPGPEVYKNLHMRMRVVGFLQTVSGVDAQGRLVTLNLPHATYYGSNSGALLEVRRWAKVQAAAVWTKESIVFVVLAENWSIS